MSRFLLIAALHLAASAAFLGAAEPAHPNIVLIYADDLGYGDITCQGATRVSTPNIDRLAKEGLRFTDGHSSSATCTPSRFSMLTGEYAFRQKGTGVLPGDAGLIIKPGRTTLPSILQKAGYKTGVVGKWHLGLGEGNVDWNQDVKPGPLEIGFNSSYIMAATGDRVPCVYVKDHKVVGLDPSDPIKDFLHFVMHLDESLPDFIRQHGIWIYGLLFLIIFCETGLVVTPFLPGDSLLFAVGAVAANEAVGNELNLWYVIPLMCVAGILGDAVNYAIGRRMGPAVFTKDNGIFLRKDYLLKAQAFYEKHGGKAIVLARFVPIVRTFAPFVAGIGRMRYASFAYFNIMGAIVWVVSLTLAGFFLGNIPIIKKNFEATIILIIVVSILPIVFEWWKARKESAHAAKKPAADNSANLPAVADVKVEPTSN